MKYRITTKEIIGYFLNDIACICMYLLEKLDIHEPKYFASYLPLYVLDGENKVFFL